MKQLAASVPQPSALQNRDSDLALSREVYCLRAVRVMYACWRKTDAFDPEIFAAGAGAVLAEYSLDIVDLVCDPRTGLPSKLQFPPTIKEIRDSCDSIISIRKEHADRDKRLRAQFAERDEYERELAERKNHQTASELEAKGYLRPRPSKPALPAERLWERWVDSRMRKGARLHPEAEAILVAAGYDVNGPDEQQPKEKAA